MNIECKIVFLICECMVLLCIIIIFIIFLGVLIGCNLRGCGDEILSIICDVVYLLWLCFVCNLVMVSKLLNLRFYFKICSDFDCV